MRPTLSAPAPTDVRYAPKATKGLRDGEWQQWANNGLTRRNQQKDRVAAVSPKFVLML